MKRNLRILAVVSLAFIIIGTVFLTIYFFKSSGAVLAVTVVSYVVGLGLYFVIHIKKGFPSQQIKEEEFKKLEREYYDKLEAESVTPPPSPPAE